MNKTNTMTIQKIMIPLRLPSRVYEELIEVVQSKKKENRGFSINEYLTDLILKDIHDFKLNK